MSRLVTIRVRRGMAVVAVAAWAVLAAMFAAAGVATADCTTAGDFGAGSGCAPPGDSSGGGGGEAWPPKSVDWPPSQDSDDSGGGGGGGSGGGGDSGGGKPTPIVMPDGSQPAMGTHVAGSGTSDKSSGTPIIGGSSSGGGTSTSTSSTPTPIVVPAPSGHG